MYSYILVMVEEETGADDDHVVTKPWVQFLPTSSYPCCGCVAPHVDVSKQESLLLVRIHSIIILYYNKVPAEQHAAVVMINPWKLSPSTITTT